MTAPAEHTPAQWRLRGLLVSSALASGAAWGAIGVSLASDADARAALAAYDGVDVVSLPTVLLTLAAAPLGSLLGAPVLGFVSHACGRRPAVLVGSVLTVLGCLIAAADGPLLRAFGIGVVGSGVGGQAIVIPKLAHELAEHGHGRLMPRVRATSPAGAALAVFYWQPDSSRPWCPPAPAESIRQSHPGCCARSGLKHHPHADTRIDGRRPLVPARNPHAEGSKKRRPAGGGARFPAHDYGKRATRLSAWLRGPPAAGMLTPLQTFTKAAITVSRPEAMSNGAEARATPTTVITNSTAATTSIPIWNVSSSSALTSAGAEAAASGAEAAACGVETATASMTGVFIAVVLPVPVRNRSGGPHSGVPDPPVGTGLAGRHPGE